MRSAKTRTPKVFNQKSSPQSCQKTEIVVKKVESHARLLSRRSFSSDFYVYNFFLPDILQWSIENLKSRNNRS
jgi:hypothetical protein